MIHGTRVKTAIAAAMLALVGGVAMAQDYPVKPITLIVPLAGGRSTDISMRAIADAASKHLGQPIAVDNKAGGSGTVGPATMAAAAKPDGYTISQIPITAFRLPLMQQVSWDPQQGFHLHRPPDGIHLRCHDQRGFPVQDLEGRCRFRQAKSRRR